MRKHQPPQHTQWIVFPTGNSGTLTQESQLHRHTLYWNGQLVWTPALALYLCVDRGLYPAGFIAHLRLYRHIRQAAIREFLFAVGSHAVIIYFGWLGLALYNIVVRIMVRVDVRVRVTQG